MEVEKRLERLEDKMDSLKEDMLDLKSSFKIHIALIEDHVAGDQKIISEIDPIIADFKYKKEREIRLYKMAKMISVIAGLGTGIVGIVSLLH